MDVLGVPDVAKMLSLSEMTIYRLAKLGKLPAKKVGRCWRFSKQALEQWLAPQSSWDEELDEILSEMKNFGKGKDIKHDDIRRAIREVRQMH